MGKKPSTTTNAKSSQKAATKKAKETVSETSQQDKLFAIRDLLFGEQVAQLESSIDSLNKLVETRFNQLEKHLEKTGNQFNKSLEQAINHLNEAIEKQHLEHTSQEAIIEDNLNSLSNAFQQFQNQTEDSLGDAEKALKQASKSLYNSLEEEVKSLNLKIEKASNELSTNKADRKTLASMLEAMATNLNQTQA